MKLKSFLGMSLFLSLVGACLAQHLPRTGKFDAVYFENETHGYVRWNTGHSQEVLKTLDGGKTWKLLSQRAVVAPFRRGRVFANSQLGWSIVEDSWPHRAIYSTEDGGLTWILSYAAIGKVPPILEGIQVVSGTEVWVVGTESFRTKDGGQSWKQVPIDGISLHFLNADCGWALADAIWKTTDGGESWRKIPVESGTRQEFELLDVFFLNRNVGWLVGGKTAANLPGGQKSGIVLFTSDGGETWARLAVLSKHYLWTVFFISESTGWVTGLDGIFLKTTDGGKTWFSP